MHALATFVSAVWVCFLIYWMVSATDAKQGSRNGLSVLPRLLTIALVVLLALVFKKSLIVHSVILHALGVIIFLAGLGVAVWARVHLGRNWGMPMTRKDEPELVTAGPYHFIRHPIYSGILLAMLGTSLAVSFYWLVALGVVGVYFIYSARVEEGLMVATFPAKYQSYQRETKMLIPFVF